MGFHFKPGLLKLELKLKKELDESLNQEETLWFQKSPEKWIKSGYYNTKFFHTSTLVRRQRNIIRGLLNDNADWVTDPIYHQTIAVNYFKDLFTEDLLHGTIPLFPHCFPR